MAGKTALMACHLEWAAPMRVGSHHIARCLADAGWQVAYVSNAISPFQALRDPHDFRRKASLFDRKGTADLGGRIWSMLPFALVTPHNAPVLRSRWVHRNWQRTTIPSLVRQVRKAGFGTVDLLYVDSPGQAFWLDELDYGASAARVMDRMTGFHGYAEEMRRTEIDLVQRVDATFFSASELEAELRVEGAMHPVHMPNGVDFAHFARADLVVPADIASIPRPMAIYTGAIDDWFDFELVDALAASMVDVSFVFVGPDRTAKERIAARANVHILGWRPFRDLPAYLHAADVGIIPFDVIGHAELVNAIHPLKLYEYLAAGLPVVATRWDELERMQSPALLVDGLGAWQRAIRTALVEPPDRAAGLDYARRADWAARVESMLTTLGLEDGRPTGQGSRR